MARKKKQVTNLELESMLDQLNLTVAKSCVSDLLHEATSRGASYSDFLRQVLQVEIDGRFGRKLNRSLKRARLGSTKSLDEFDFSLRRKLSPAAVKELLDCKWIQDARNIICLGRPGTGKTHVTKALGYAACMQGFSVYYLTVAQLLDELHAALADETYQRVFRRYARVDLLIAEELGGSLDQQKADYLYRLVSQRYENKAMIITANTGFESWSKFFPGKAQAIATIDRLVDRATILRFTGKSFRKPKDIYGAPLDEDKET